MHNGTPSVSRGINPRLIRIALLLRVVDRRVAPALVIPVGLQRAVCALGLTAAPHARNIAARRLCRIARRVFRRGGK